MDEDLQLAPYLDWSQFQGYFRYGSIGNQGA